MRLIDADALPRHGKRGGLVHWQDIDNAPTIEAICVEKAEEPKVLRRCGTCRYNILDDPIMCNPCQHYDHWAERKTPTDGREEEK